MTHFQENNGNDRPDDRALVRAAKGGDLAAFEELVKRHERRIYGLARRMTGAEHEAQDVTQQTFLSAVKNLAGFREAAAFSTWLTAIAANAALKMARKRGGLPTSSLEKPWSRTGTGMSRTRNTLRTGANPRTAWPFAPKHTGCSMTPLPDWERDSAPCSCFGTWKDCRSGIQPGRLKSAKPA